MAPSAVQADGLDVLMSRDAPVDVDASVLIVGAGPAGLMLASNLVRFGIDIKIVDDRPDKTATGRADGLQPKTIETFKQMRLAEPLLRKGVRVYDICFWNSTPTQKLARQSREVHYPADAVDTLDPYILLVHQGMVEDVFLADLESRGGSVIRSAPFQSASRTAKSPIISSICGTQEIKSRFLIGCDGAHSKVRKSIPGVEMKGESGKAAWGVIDGVLKTNFPDVWSKTAIHSSEHGSVLCIPRERNMTRLYIELHAAGEPDGESKVMDQEGVMRTAKKIMSPFEVEWESVEWFSIYRVGQRLVSSFTSQAGTTILTGDAAHTHSPKAAQGMNVSMHDSLNLGWKLALSLRSIGLPALLATYASERRQIAQQLLDFDFEHANAFHDGDAQALADNFAKNIRFISGVGADYATNVLNASEAGISARKGEVKGGVGAGKLVPCSKATRFIDANPVDLQLDVPMLCQFRIYFVVADVKKTLPFLEAVCAFVDGAESILGKASRKAEESYRQVPARWTEEEREYGQVARYTAASKLFTPAILFSGDKWGVEIDDLPPLLKKSPWTVYHDDLGAGQKWLGDVGQEDVAIVNVRPDGYVGSVGRWKVGEEEVAKSWLESYYGAFLTS